MVDEKNNVVKNQLYFSYSVQKYMQLEQWRQDIN